MDDETPDEDFNAKIVGTSLDIYDCSDCGHKGHCLLVSTATGEKRICSECRSPNVKLFMKRPPRVASAVDKEFALSEIDPDWRERFHGDEELAIQYYTRNAP